MTEDPTAPEDVTLMASVWTTSVPTKDGGKRYRVMYRLGGRESTPRHGGSFKVERLAQARKRWI